MTPFDKLIAAIAESQAKAIDKAEKAHSHAKEFAKALDDEVAAAERVGACSNCITGALQNLTIRRIVRTHNPGEVNMEEFARTFEETVNQLTAKIVAEVLEYRAEQIAARIIAEKAAEAAATV